MLKKVMVHVCAFLLFLLGFGFFIYAGETVWKKYSDFSQKNTVNPFGQFTKESTNSIGGDEAPKPDSYGISPDVVKSLNNDAHAIYLFKVGWDLTPIQSSDPWDYKTSVFSSQVESYDASSKRITLKITEPDKMPYAGNSITSDLKCETATSYFTKGNDTTNEFADLAMSIEANDTFMSMCLDENCSSVGGFCKLVKAE